MFFSSLLLQRSFGPRHVRLISSPRPLISLTRRNRDLASPSLTLEVVSPIEPCGLFLFGAPPPKVFLGLRNVLSSSNAQLYCLPPPGEKFFPKRLLPVWTLPSQCQIEMSRRLPSRCFPSSIPAAGYLSEGMGTFGQG